MKLLLLPLIFLGIYFANTSQNYQKLPQKSCEIIGEVQNLEPWMKTLAIVKFDETLYNTTIDKIMKCLPEEITVITIDAMNYVMENPRLHNVHYVMAFIDEFDNGKLTAFYNLISDKVAKPHLDHTAKYLILTTRLDSHKTLAAYLDSIAIVNFAIVSEESGEVLVSTRANFGSKPSPALTLDLINRGAIEKIYPNHLKNLRGQRHMVIVIGERPGIRIENGVVYSKYMHLLTTISEKENSVMQIMSPNGDLHAIMDFYTQQYNTRKMQVTLNRGLEIGTGSKLMTYEETGFCMIVPKREMIRSFQLNKPFEWTIWTGILVSILACMILWRFSGSSISCWFIPFFFWSFALGQGINFSTNKKALVILLQILVLMLFILGNAYQGVITSVMIEPEQAEQLKSFDELLKSDHTILISENRNLLLKDYPGYREAVERGKVFIPNQNYKLNLTKLYGNNTAQLVACELSDHLVSTGEASNFYVIRENMFPTYIQLYAGYLNKFLKRWQLIMDLCFEAGLPQIWKEYAKTGVTNKHIDHLLLKQSITLDSLWIIFIILLLGYGLAFLALLGEIFWHDCVSPYWKRRKDLKEQRNTEGIRQYRGFWGKWLRGRKMKVRRIQVKPINKEE